MVSLSPKAKAKYAKYVGPDGKLIIDESLPENIKEAFQFFNDRNINILEMNIDPHIETLDEELEDNIVADNFDEDVNDEEVLTPNLVEDDNTNIDVDNLNNFFE